MSNVIRGKFGQKQEVVFQCINCEAQTFWLDEGGTVTCQVCKAKQLPPEEWLEKAREMHDPEGTQE